MNTRRRIAPAQQPAMNWLKQLNPIPLPSLSEQPLISVLVVNYNYGRYLSQALDSVLAQTYQNFEICICDDGSTDNSRAIINAYTSRHTNLKSIFQANGGMAVAMNSAFQLVTGEIVCLIDADDVWLPTKLERTIASFRQHPEAGLSQHLMTQVGPDLQTVLTELFPPYISPGYLAPTILSAQWAMLAPCSGISIRREVADLSFPLNPVFRSRADAILREHAALLTPVAALDESLCLMRLHGKNLTTTLQTPTDPAHYKDVANYFNNLWRDRQEFLQKQLRITVDPDIWVMEGLHPMILDLLLNGESLDPNLLTYVPGRKERNLWRLMFSFPVILRSFAYWQLWYRPMIWKKALHPRLHALRFA